ncbi:L-arabinose isomerase [Lederbergia galactosidilytica]|uniref:L-arabinose isomerase n=1 Tax=Lederbergia galactosidilytica TaxID=217031 RepID=A0A177ZUK1_9BACI|nr:L-arabinose isomerase [Lederbergia galactosidilytica]KRG09341.1 arabinose isomerase [Virgibacillus soli]MBP1913435.1 L-arabinose isomerase [Lederbergia galactosidilytica]OAK71393.1 arabinose isomerase [Lederbergia galactosidilytica]
MLKVKDYEFWFVTGSQDLYGEDVIRQVEEHSRKMVAGLDEDPAVTYKLVFKSVVKEADSIRRLFLEANADENCAGIITWMHTFSPAKMWIAGLNALKKPLLHLHTQFNRDIPWDSIDMDFMNLNQSAHGDREFGFIGSRMNIKRKVIVGHWENEVIRGRIGSWMRTAVAVSESHTLKIARFGDNMRNVAVTEGDKVEAQIKLGWTVDGYGVGDLVERIEAVSEQDINRLMDEYAEKYTIVPEGLQDGAVKESIRYQAKLEIALKAFLEEGGYTAFSNTFEDLHGMHQLPGLATQRLMEQGYGYGGEGDWKTAALVRLMKIIADGKDTSFMEDYTYHFEPGNEMVLGSHMLEVCPTIAEAKPRIEVHPLGIGGKEDPARLVFNGHEGAALNASIIDLGHRFRLVINEVDAVKIEKDMPKLPVARVLWKLQPSMSQGAENWLMAGGAHHSCFSYRVTTEQLKDFADLLGIESVLINNDTKTPAFENELRLNELFYK